MEERLSRLFRKLPMPNDKNQLPSLEEALPGRSEAMPLRAKHFVLGTEIQPPFPEGHEEIILTAGCKNSKQQVYIYIHNIYIYTHMHIYIYILK